MSNALGVWGVWKQANDTSTSTIVCYSTEEYGYYKLWDPSSGISITCASGYFNWILDYMKGSSYNGPGFASVFVDWSGPVRSYVAESTDGASYRSEDFGTAYAWAVSYTWSGDAS